MAPRSPRLPSGKNPSRASLASVRARGATLTRAGCRLSRVGFSVPAGTPEEIIARLKRLEAGGIENVLFAAPGASVAGLRTFAEEIMPAFAGDPMRLAQV